MRKFQKLWIFIVLIGLLYSCGKKFKDDQDGPEQGDLNNKITSQKLIKELQVSIDSQDVNVLNVTLEKIDHINFKFSNGETPLTYSIKIAKNEITFLLLKKTHNINLPNDNGLTPLILSISLRNNQDLSFKLLREPGIDVNIKSPNDKSALEYAIESKQEKIAIDLIIKGIDYNLYTSSPVNHLQMAQNYKLKKLRKLLSEIKNIKEKSLTLDDISESINQENSNLLSFLLTQYAPSFDILREYNFLNEIMDLDNQSLSKNLLTLFLQSGSPINLINVSEEPALIKSILDDKIDHFEILMNYNPDLNLLGISQKSALDIAVSELKVQVVRKLKQKGAQRVYSFIDTDDEEKTKDICESDDLSSVSDDDKDKANQIKNILECSETTP